MTKLSSTYPIALTFDQHPITVLTDEAGAPWWVADEVCAALTIAMPHRALAGLDDDEKGRHTVTTPGGPQRKATINESGLYSLILRSRKPEAKRFKKWVTSEVLPQIRKTGSYSSTLTTREADLSALTDAVSAIVPALTAITTTLAALGARVAALETRPATGRTGPDFYAMLAAHFEPDAGTWMTNEEVRAVLRPGAWNKSEVIALNKALVQLGATERRRHGNIRIFGVRRIGLPALRRQTGPFDRPGLPAPKLADGVHVFGPPWAKTSERGTVQGLEARVRIEDGFPLEVYAPRYIPDAAYLKDTERAFAQAFPGYHLKSDWRSRGGWASGYEPPTDAGLTAQVQRATRARPVGRVINDEDFNAVAVEFKGAKADLPAISAELSRLRYQVGPWRQAQGAWRAEVLH